MIQLKWQLTFLFLLLLCQRNIARQNIIYGASATSQQFSYQVYIEARVHWQWHGICGGAVISNKQILTAAHCLLYKWRAYKIFYGAIDKSTNFEKGQRRSIIFPRYTYAHPKWNQKQNLYDIGLIRLLRDLHFNEYVQPARLPDQHQMYSNYDAVVSGWGITAKNWPKSEKLLYLNVTVLSNEECKLLVDKLMPHLVFSPTWICTKPNKKFPCQMDNGGPLAIRNEDGTSTVIGIASIGMDVDCNRESGRPVIYTRISSYLEWISSYDRLFDELDEMAPYISKILAPLVPFSQAMTGREKKELKAQVERLLLLPKPTRKGRSRSRAGSSSKDTKAVANTHKKRNTNKFPIG